MWQMHWVCLPVYVVVYCLLLLMFASLMVCLSTSYFIVCLPTVTRLYCTGSEQVLAFYYVYHSSVCRPTCKSQVCLSFFYLSVYVQYLSSALLISFSPRLSVSCMQVGLSRSTLFASSWRYIIKYL